MQSHTCKPAVRIRGGGVRIGALALVILASLLSASRPLGHNSGAFILSGYGSSAVLASSAPGVVHAAPGAVLTTASFVITGNVSGLYPGGKFPLVLTIANKQAVTITVTSITTSVSDASSGCTAGNVKVTSYSGNLVIAPGKKGKATVKVTMAHSAPDACQGQTFAFHYTGVAS